MSASSGAEADRVVSADAQDGTLGAYQGLSLDERALRRVMRLGEYARAALRKGSASCLSDRYDITCHDSLGRVMFQIRRSVPQGRVTERARQAFRDAQAGIRPDWSSRYAGQLLEHRKRVAAAARFAAVYPAFSQLLLARSGELWVRAFAVRMV